MANPAPLYDDPAVYARRWRTLTVLCLSLLLVIVANSSLNVTLPTLSRDLRATNSELQWVVAVYSLVFAGLLFSTGALGDRFGRKGALQTGLVLFLLGVALAIASNAMWQLIACRALMGIGAAFIMPSTLSILVNVFPPGERTRAIAIWASIGGAAGMIGPVISGFLLDHFWYGSVFLVNIPIVVVALVAGHYLVPRSKNPADARLDPLGAVLSTIGIGALVYGLIEAPDKGWASQATVLAFIVGVVMLVLFVVWERRVAEPMLDMRFFRNASFSTATAGMILVYLAMFGMTFLVVQYFQLVLGFSPLGTALRFLPISPIFIIVTPLTPRLSTRFGTNRVVAIGMATTTVGLFLLRGLSIDTAYGYTVLCMTLMVSGIALTMSPMTSAIMSAVPANRAGAGSAMNDATREVGAAMGIAVFGSLAASQYRSHVGPLVRGLSTSLRASARTSVGGAVRAASTLPRGPSRALIVGAQQAFVDGIRVGVTVGAILTGTASLFVLRYLPRVTHHQTDMSHAEPEPE